MMTGCAAPLQRYAPAIGDQAALIKFYDKSANTFALISESERCEQGQEERKASTWKWVDVPAGRRLYVRHGSEGGGMAGSCSVRYSFVPEDGESYVSDFVYPGPLRCEIVFYKMGKNQVDERVRVETFRREKKC